MNEKVVSGIMSVIEGLDIENMALRSYLKVCSQPLTDSQVERLIQEAHQMPGLEQKVSLRWKRLRDQMQSDQALEEALSKFSKITPRPTDVN